MSWLAGWLAGWRLAELASFFFFLLAFLRDDRSFIFVRQYIICYVS